MSEDELEIRINLYINKQYPIMVYCKTQQLDLMIKEAVTENEQDKLISCLKYIHQQARVRKHFVALQKAKTELGMDEERFSSIKPSYRNVEDVFYHHKMIDKRSSLSAAFHSLCKCEDHFEVFNEKTASNFGVIQYPSKREAVKWAENMNMPIITKLEDIRDKSTNFEYQNKKPHDSLQGIIINLSQVIENISNEYIERLKKYDKLYVLEPYITSSTHTIMKLIDRESASITELTYSCLSRNQSRNSCSEHQNLCGSGRKVEFYHTIYQFFDELFSGSKSVLFTNRHSIADLCRYLCEMKGISYSYYGPRNGDSCFGDRDRGDLGEMQFIDWSSAITIIDGNVHNKLKDVPGKVFFHMSYKDAAYFNIKKLRNVKTRVNRKIGIFVDDKKDSLPDYTNDFDITSLPELISALRDKRWSISYTEDPRTVTDLFNFRKVGGKHMSCFEYKTICTQIKEMHKEKIYLGVEEDDICYYKTNKIRRAILGATSRLSLTMNISKNVLYPMLNRSYLINEMKDIVGRIKSPVTNLTGRVSLKKVYMIKVNKNFLFVIAKLLYSINCLKVELLGGVVKDQHTSKTKLPSDEKFIDNKTLSRVYIDQDTYERILTHFSSIKCINSWPPITDTVEFLSQVFYITLRCVIIEKCSKLYFKRFDQFR